MDKIDLESPWIGLKSFAPETRSLFFGRDREIDELCERVRRNPVTILYGSSGYGKSSLLGAGLLPRLGQAGFLPIPIKLQFANAGSKPDRLTLVDQVKAQIATALTEARRSDLAEKVREPGGFWESFNDERRGFLDPSAPRPVLVFDQFEDVFTLGERSVKERDQLLHELSDIIENRPSSVLARRLESDPALAEHFDSFSRPTKVVITLREDYLSKLDRWRPVMPSIMANRMELRPLCGPQALLAVYEPGRLVGREIVSRSVAEKIVRSVAGFDLQANLSEIEAVPPLLSLYSERLNKRRRDEGRLTIQEGDIDGKLDEILDEFFEECFDGLPAGIRTFVEKRLISPGSPSVREAPSLETVLAELSTFLDPEAATNAIEELRNRRLITQEEFEGVVRVRIIHDILTPVVARSRDSDKQNVETRRAVAQSDAAVIERAAASEKRPSRIASSAQTLKIYVSSPGDTGLERKIVEETCGSIERQFGGSVVLERYLWEDSPFSAGRDFQESLPDIAEMDIAIFILRNRLGSLVRGREPQHNTFQSATEYEYLKAVDAHQINGKPEILFYVSADLPSLSSITSEEKEERLYQLDLRNKFLASTFRDNDSNLTYVYHKYGSVAAFSARLKSDLLVTVDNLASSRVHPKLEPGMSPYVGMRSYSVRDAPIFFGREQDSYEVEELLQIRAREGCASVLINGPNGCGKTSFLQAGIAPLLEKAGIDCNVRIVNHRPAQSQIDLITSLVRACCNDQSLPEAGDLGDFASSGAMSAEQAADSIHRAIGLASIGRESPLVLVILIDQVEELYTGTHFGFGDREAYFNCLRTLAQGGRCQIIAAIRSQFLAAAVADAAFAQLFWGGSVRGQYFLKILGLGDLGRVIEFPARTAGVTFEHRNGLSLAEKIREDLACEEGNSLIPLQTVLYNLWRDRTQDGMLTFEAYEGLGGLAGVLSNLAENAFSRLPIESAAQFDMLAGELVEIPTQHGNFPDGEDYPVRRRVPMDRITGDPKMRNLVDALCENYVLTVEDAQGGNFAVLAHDAFLHSWPRLRDFIEREREYLRIRTRIESLSREWMDSGYDEGLLIRQPTLLRAGRALLHRDSSFSSLASEFVVASLRLEQRIGRRRKLMSMVFMLFLLGGTVLLFLVHHTSSTEAKQAALREYEAKDRLERFKMESDKVLSRRTEMVRILGEQIGRARDSGNTRLAEDLEKLFQMTLEDVRQLGGGDGNLERGL